jgi:hypothetical protein
MNLLKSKAKIFLHIDSFCVNLFQHDARGFANIAKYFTIMPSLTKECIMTKFQDGGYRKSTPLWKWIIIILIVVAMPLFFSYYRVSTLRYTINTAMPQTNAEHHTSQP